MMGLELMLARALGMTPEEMKGRFHEVMGAAEKGVEALASIEKGVTTVLARLTVIEERLERIENGGDKPRKRRGSSGAGGDGDS